MESQNLSKYEPISVDDPQFGICWPSDTHVRSKNREGYRITKLERAAREFKGTNKLRIIRTNAGSQSHCSMDKDTAKDVYEEQSRKSSKRLAGQADLIQSLRDEDHDMFSM